MRSSVLLDRSAMSGDLAAMLADVLHAERIGGLRRLSGGASRETWSFDADGRPLILQRSNAPTEHDEASVLRAAAGAGVPVASVVASGSGETPFVVVERLEGETIAPRILRDDAYAEARSRLPAQCGAALA